MLNVRALNGLLTENTDSRLFPRWFIMTINGAMIAYSTPADIRELRDQIALISMTWKEQVQLKESSDHEATAENIDPLESSTSSSSQRTLNTMTMEFDKRNIIVRYLGPKLLLVLEGGVPPSRKRPLKITTEAPGELRYPPEQEDAEFLLNHTNGVATLRGNDEEHAEQAGSPSAASQASTAISSSTSGRRISLLNIHRKKIDALAKTIVEEFESSGFEMPDDPGDKFF